VIDGTGAEVTVIMWCSLTPGVSGTSKPFSVWIDGLFRLKT
jgi:hypothetical protein